MVVTEPPVETAALPRPAAERRGAGVAEQVPASLVAPALQEPARVTLVLRSSLARLGPLIGRPFAPRHKRAVAP